MANITELAAYFDTKIPSSLSLPWDNDGIMCCPDPHRSVLKALCVLDVNAAAVDYACAHSFDTIVSHHPLIFKPLTSLTSPMLIKLITCGISVLSYHTRYDAVGGGVNDMLAELLGLSGTIPFAEGCGRIGCIFETDARSLAIKVKEKLGCPQVFVSGGGYFNVAAVVSGSGGDFIGEARSMGAGVFITGEAGYHKMTGADGICVIEAGHYYTEKHSAKGLEKLITSFDKEIHTETFIQNDISIV